MRKLLLFGLAFGISFAGFSQKNVNAFEKIDKQQQTYSFAKDVDGHGALPVNKSRSDKGSVIVGVPISSSANVYGYLVETQSCLTYNKDINVIHFTHRANPAVLGSSSGDIISSQSRDGGWTWKQNMAYPNATGYNNRYPGGVLYNPSGDTDPDNAYVIFVGPSHNGGSSDVWQHAFLGSMKLDSTNIDRQYAPTFGAIVRMGLQATTDGKFHVISSNYDDNYNLDTIRLYEGTWDNTNNKVNWVCHKLSANFVKGSDGNDFAYVWNFNTAWSADGTIGYYWTLGRDSSNDTRSYQPIVWKTTNSGSTWTKMPVYDFSNIATITNELRPVLGDTIKRPQFTSAIDGVVDANGNLHLVCKIASAYSNHNDSLGYRFTQTFEGQPGHNTIFDVFTTSSGWDAKKLGVVYTIDVSRQETPYGDIGWDMRLQAGRTVDGTKIFASWTDTDTTIAMKSSKGFLMNSSPDIHYAGVDVVSGNVIADVNFTDGTAVGGDCYFHYMSDILPVNSNGDVEMLFTELDLGTTPTDPVAIRFIKLSADGFNDNAKNIATVSQNRPNPFSGVTNIEVTLTESAEMSIEVVNIAGQKVVEQNYGKTAAGVHTIQINAANLPAGMYFYTVHAGNTSVTKKMIVR
jgi:hypothetical protein